LGSPFGFEYNDGRKAESGGASAANEGESFGDWRNHDFGYANPGAASSSQSEDQEEWATRL
jgi:hypothetical protein